MSSLKDMILCPYCAEKIEGQNTICPYCHSSLVAPDDSRQWYRCKQGKILFGVCAGLARRFEIPVFTVRMAFIIATVFGGWGVFIYLCLWLLMPQKAE